MYSIHTVRPRDYRTVGRICCGNQISPSGVTELMAHTRLYAGKIR